jgi:hypothetical protein
VCTQVSFSYLYFSSFEENLALRSPTLDYEQVHTGFQLLSCDHVPSHGITFPSQNSSISSPLKTSHEEKTEDVIAMLTEGSNVADMIGDRVSIE